MFAFLLLTTLLFSGCSKSSKKTSEQSNSKGESGEESSEYFSSGQQSSDQNVHTVTFDTHGGSDIPPQYVPHGEKATEPDIPTRPGYTFDGWTYQGKPWVFYGYVVTEDMTLDANWIAIEYTATFKNDDGTVLEIQNPVYYGDVLTYGGETPIKPNPEEHYIYFFDGWDKELVVLGDMTFIAQYRQEFAPYTAQFYDEDGNLLYETLVREGETPTYVGEEPTKASTSDTQYQFNGWDLISSDNNVFVYKPHFESCTKGLIFEGSSVYQYAGSSKTVVIPGRWNGVDITSISSNAFDNSMVKEVIISEGMKTISSYAFRNCSSLASITIPDTVMIIEDGVFYGCTSFTSFVIPDGVTSIGNSVFFNCTSLASITIPDGVTSIGDYVFFNCTSLASITIPDGVTSIGDEAFYNCKSLTSVSIPNSVTSIGNSVFFNCTSLKSATIGKGLNSISDKAFYGCTSLTSVIIPLNVTYIGSYAFYGCTLLTSITIPDGVKWIDGNAFSGCTSLKSITIPESLISIGDNVFKDCTNLVINCEVEYKPKSWDGSWQSDAAAVIWGATGEKITIDGYTYGLGIVLGEKQATLISIDETIINFDSATEIQGYRLVGIANNIFIENEKIETVILPDVVTYIANSAFVGCTSLKSITIPDSVTYIGESAFYGCTSLTSITIPDSVKSIGAEAFCGCTSLTSINIPDGVTSIGSRAFYGCTSLTSVTIGKGLKGISNRAFYGCTSLKTVIIPLNVTYIDDYAFYGCSALTSITYNGTTTDWYSVKTGFSWEYDSGLKTIHCTDGDIKI